MRMMFWFFSFVVILLVTVVLVLTFIQPAFKVEVGAKILTYTTKALPVYVYVIGAFCIGLLIGLTMTAIGFFSAQAKIFKKNRLLRDLEMKLSLASTTPKSNPVSDRAAPSVPPEPVRVPEQGLL